MSFRIDDGGTGHEGNPHAGNRPPVTLWYGNGAEGLHEGESSDWGILTDEDGTGHEGAPHARDRAPIT